MKSSVALIMAGVGGTLLYQQVKNGNVQKMMKKMMKGRLNYEYLRFRKSNYYIKKV